MSDTFVTFEPTGYWEGTGTEFQLTRAGNITEQPLKLTKKIVKHKENIYTVEDKFYYIDTCEENYSSQYFIDSKGINSFLTPDDTGAGLDTWLFNNEKMKFDYDLNGVLEEFDSINKSLFGRFNLVKKESEKQSELCNDVDSNIKTLKNNNIVVNDYNTSWW
jgi:hypothetical protein